MELCHTETFFFSFAVHTRKSSPPSCEPEIASCFLYQLALLPLGLIASPLSPSWPQAFVSLLPLPIVYSSRKVHTHTERESARPIEGWIEEGSVVLFLLFLLPSGRANVTSEKYLRFSIDSICMLVLIEKGNVT